MKQHSHYVTFLLKNLLSFCFMLFARSCLLTPGPSIQVPVKSGRFLVINLFFLYTYLHLPPTTAFLTYENILHVARNQRISGFVLQIKGVGLCYFSEY